MYTLIIFTILCVIEFIYLWMVWGEIKEWKEMGSMVVETVASDGNAISSSINKVVIPAKKGLRIVALFFNRFRALLIIPIAIIFMGNLFISVILGWFVMLILNIL